MKSAVENKGSLKGWISLIILIIMFSGIFENAQGPLKALDLSNLIGEFGKIEEVANFTGSEV